MSMSVPTCVKTNECFFFHNFVPRKTYITRVRTPIADKNEKYSFK